MTCGVEYSRTGDLLVSGSSLQPSAAPEVTHLFGVKDVGPSADTVGVGPDLTAPGNRTACPSCGARVRSEATFCGQCYADFRPPPPPVASAPLTPAPNAAYGPPAADPLTAPLLDVVLPPGAVPAQAQAPEAVTPRKTASWPCTRCEAQNELAAIVCSVCGTPFLAKLAEETKVALVLPVVGDLSRYGRGQRAAIACGALLVILVPLALITLLLTKAPPPSAPATQSTTTTTTDTTVPDPSSTPGVVLPSPGS
jgi:DNA-directed RNA polymerase subunit RPC12/RpoP